MDQMNGDTQNIADVLLNPSHIRENLLHLRRRLMLSQGEFIEKYLSKEDGTPLLSVSKLSNIETKGGKDTEKYAEIIAAQLSMDPALFQLTPDAFAKNIDVFIEKQVRSASGDNLSDLAQMVQKTSYVETLVRVISDYLTDNLISGALKPGDKLPSDRNLAVMFGVGRTAIREALKVLSVLGLIRILPGQGTFVASNSTNFFMAPLSWTFLLGEHNLENVLTVRTMLECTASRLAAWKATDEELDGIEAIIHSAQEAFSNYNFQKFLEYDMDFHLSLAKSSHNPIIYELLATSRKLMAHISQSGLLGINDMIEVDKEHSHILESIRTRDPEIAYKAMADHMVNSNKRYKIT